MADPVGQGGTALLVTTQVSAAAGMEVYLAPSETIIVTGTVIAGPLFTSQSSLTTGAGVWLAPTQTINVGQSVQTPVMIAASIALAAAASSSAGPMPFTIYVGTTAATVTSAWSVPATNFRVNFVQILMTGAGATTPTVGYFQIAYSSVGTTGTATSPAALATRPQLIAIPVGNGPAAASFGLASPAMMDIGGGLTQTVMLWWNYAGTTNTSMTALLMVMGYLF